MCIREQGTEQELQSQEIPVKDLESETSNTTIHNSIYKMWNNYRRKRDVNFERYKILGWKVRWKITAVQ